MIQGEECCPEGFGKSDVQSVVASDVLTEFERPVEKYMVGPAFSRPSFQVVDREGSCGLVEEAAAQVSLDDCKYFCVNEVGGRPHRIRRHPSPEIIGPLTVCDHIGEDARVNDQHQAICP